MSQFIIIYLSCVLAMVCQVQCATKTSCSNERADLRNEVVASHRELVNLGKLEMPSFYSKGIKCHQGYMKKESPFPTVMLKGSLRNFVGPKFLEQNYKLFQPFLDACSAIQNGSTIVPTKAPEVQLGNVKTNVAQLVWCTITEGASVYKTPTVKYSASSHKTVIKQCLINAGIKATAIRVKIVQYSEIFEELYDAVKGMNSIAARIKFLRLK